MNTKRPLPKRSSGMKRVSGILVGLLALALVAASPASAAPFAYVSNSPPAPSRSSTAPPTRWWRRCPRRAARRRRGQSTGHARLRRQQCRRHRLGDRRRDEHGRGWSDPDRPRSMGRGGERDGSRVYVAKDSGGRGDQHHHQSRRLSRITTGGVLNGIAVSGSTLFATVGNGTVS